MKKKINSSCILGRYVAVYLSILFVRYKVGIVSKDMLRLPKFPFMAIGLLEALGVAVGMSAGGTFLELKGLRILKRKYICSKLSSSKKDIDL